jgi:hypothetical protein
MPPWQPRPRRSAPPSTPPPGWPGWTRRARTRPAACWTCSARSPAFRRASIAGFGRYAYRYDSGHAGESLATGFSPRKAEISVYIPPGYADFGPILARLGPHRTGKACLYLRRLDRIDLDALADLIRAGLADLGTRWIIHPA